MKIIFISGNGQRHYKLTLGKWLYALLLALLLFLIFIFIRNYNMLSGHNDLTYGDVKIINMFDSYLKRLATLEAQTQRLNALGARIAKKNNIDIDSFSLEKNPARGGIISNHFNEDIIVVGESDLIKSIKKAEYVLAEKEKIFNSYEDLKTVKINRKLLEISDIEPEFIYSSPVNKGYISSAYGRRRDPINGKHRFHKGLDIAGRTGTLINTIASGFVSFTGRKGGYGKVVEIQHSDSLKSRYAHLSVISVRKGQVVRKGDSIAKMGSTGRVTGPHLHLEVWKSGKAVNPNVYLKEALGKLSKR